MIAFFCRIGIQAEESLIQRAEYLLKSHLSHRYENTDFV